MKVTKANCLCTLYIRIQLSFQHLLLRKRLNMQSKRELELKRFQISFVGVGPWHWRQSVEDTSFGDVI